MTIPKINISEAINTFDPKNKFWGPKKLEKLRF